MTRRTAGSATVQALILISGAIAVIAVATRLGAGVKTRFECQGQTIDGIAGGGAAGASGGCADGVAVQSSLPAFAGELPEPPRASAWGALSSSAPRQAAASVRLAAANLPAPTQFPPPSGDPVSVRYVAEGSDVTTQLVQVIRFGEAEPATTLRGMVDSILRRANGHPIDHLMIEGHGTPGEQSYSEVGSISATAGFELSEYARNELGRLRPYLTPNARLTLLGCDVGGGPNGERLISDLVETLGVEVHASTTLNRPLSPGFEGTEVVATPTADGVRIEYRESWIDGFARMAAPGDDDNARDYVDRYRDVMDALLLSRRYALAHTLLGGYGSEADGEAILTLFDTAPPDERRELYRYLEHHPWAGDFVEGWFTDDDSLWNTLSREQAQRLRDLLNEPAPR